MEVLIVGRLTLQLGNRTIVVSVCPIVRSSILNNPEAFRLGNIGPVAFPWVYEGQMTILGGEGSRGALANGSLTWWVSRLT